MSSAIQLNDRMATYSRGFCNELSSVITWRLTPKFCHNGQLGHEISLACLIAASVRLQGTTVSSGRAAAPKSHDCKRSRGDVSYQAPPGQLESRILNALPLQFGYRNKNLVHHCSNQTIHRQPPVPVQVGLESGLKTNDNDKDDDLTLSPTRKRPRQQGK